MDSYYIASIGSKGYVAKDNLSKQEGSFMITSNIMDAYSMYDELNAKKLAIAVVYKFGMPSTTPIKVHKIGIVETPVNSTAGFDTKLWKEING